LLIHQAFVEWKFGGRNTISFAPDFLPQNLKSQIPNPMTIVTITQIIWAFSAVSLIVLVLLHSPKGDGLAGLGGQAQLFTSTKSAENTLNRVTWTLTVLFIGLTIVLSAGWLSTGFVPPATNAPAVDSPVAPDVPSSPEPAPEAPAVE
jgi:preprotein translocase subunit SecG